MDDALRQALEPVLRDLVSSALQPPEIEDRESTDDPQFPSAMLWAADRSGRGVSVSRAAAEHDRVVDAADQVQEWVIENQLWGHAPTNWPPCPDHPRTHPLGARALDGVASRVSPLSAGPVLAVGGL